MDNNFYVTYPSNLNIFHKATIERCTYNQTTDYSLVQLRFKSISELLYELSIAALVKTRDVKLIDKILINNISPASFIHIDNLLSYLQAIEKYGIKDSRKLRVLCSIASSKISNQYLVIISRKPSTKKVSLDDNIVIISKAIEQFKLSFSELKLNNYYCYFSNDLVDMTILKIILDGLECLSYELIDINELYINNLLV